MNEDKIFDEFNKTLEEFMVKLINQIKNEPKLKRYYSAFKVAKMFKKSLPLQMYMGGCIKFETQIKDRDVNFFLKRETFIEECVKCTSFTDDIGIIDHWNNLSESSTKAIWDYVQTLYVIGEMHIKKDASAITKINNVYNNLTLDEMNRFENDNCTFSDSFVSKINQK